MTDEQSTEKDPGQAEQSVATVVAANPVAPATETKETVTKAPVKEAKAAPVKEAKRPPVPRKKLSPQAERLAQIKRDKRKKHHRLMHKQTRG